MHYVYDDGGLPGETGHMRRCPIDCIHGCPECLPEEPEVTLDDTAMRIHGSIQARVNDLFDDPDFAGVLFQHWHVSGDERMENGSPHFAVKGVGRDLIESFFQQARDSDDFTCEPLFRR